MNLTLWTTAILAPAAALMVWALTDNLRLFAIAAASVGLAWAVCASAAIISNSLRSDTSEKARLRKSASDALDLSKRLLDENVLMRHRLDYHIAKPYWAEDGWTSGMKLRHSTDQPRIPSITKREREAIEALAGDAP